MTRREFGQQGYSASASDSSELRTAPRPVFLSDRVVFGCGDKIQRVHERGHMGPLSFANFSVRCRQGQAFVPSHVRIVILSATAPR